MKIAARFSPNAQASISTVTGIASGTFNATLPPGDGKMLIYNGTLIDLIFTFGVSTFVDIVPAQSMRTFEFGLADWGHITWQSATPVPAFLLPTVQTSQTFCTVVVYEKSETIPPTFATTSYVDPFSVVIQAGRDVNFTGFFTGNTGFTLTSQSTFNRPMYLQKILISVRPTIASGDRTTLDIVDQIGNDICHLFIGPDSTTANDAPGQIISIDFDPAIIYQLGTVQIIGSFSSINNGGNTGGCGVTIFTYYC